MDNTIHSDELQHHGTKGMKWGRRLYQNKDGSLTPLGQKRYNKEVEKLKKETAKVKEAEKAAATRKKTQAKIDKLEADKAKLEARKKALRGDPDGKKEDKHPEETPEQRRERLLKSTNPKELYEGKDDLSYQELNDRISRIDLEAKLQNRIPAEPDKPSITDSMDKASVAITKATNLYRSVDSAYSTVVNSAIGKTLAKQLGIEPPKKEYDIMEKWKNRKQLNSQEFQELANRIENEKKASRGLRDLAYDAKPATKFEDIESFNKDVHNRTPDEIAKYAKTLKDAEYIRGVEESYKKAVKKAQEEAAKKDADAKKAEEAAKKSNDKKAAAQKEVDDYNERWQRGETDTKYGKSGSQILDAKYDTKADAGKKVYDQLLLTGPTKNSNDSTPRIGSRKISGLLEFDEQASDRRKKGETIIDVEPDEVIYLKDKQSTGKKAAEKVSTTAKKDHEYIKREKDGDSWKYTYEDDGAKAAEKALKNLQAAAKKSSEAASRTPDMADVNDKLIKTNEKRLKKRK